MFSEQIVKMSFPLKTFLFPFLALFVIGGLCFDSTLDTHKETRRWKFNGDYTYAKSERDETIRQLQQQTLDQTQQPQVLASGEFERDGIWLIKYDPEGTNHWNMSYSLSHLLFYQGWVTLLAHPSVPIVFKARDKKVGRFWSDGRGWCDAVFDIGLKNSFTAEVVTRNPGEYALIDKVVLGIMGNITALDKKKNLNPCLTTPKLAESEGDNEVKRRTTLKTTTTTTPQPSTQEDKTTTISTAGPQSQSPQKPGTSTRSYQTERGGAKCDCICTCTKPTNNSTTTTQLG